jgi:predicted MFS family arabinose efflux permease
MVEIGAGAAQFSCEAKHERRQQMPPSRDRSAWVITLAAAAILMVTMGTRQSLGLFISPLEGSTGLGITTISLAFAIAQLLWGVIQPVSGAVADRYGPATILVAGLIVLAIGMASTPFMTSGFGLIFSLGLLSAIGSGAASFSVLIGAAAQHLATDKRGKAAGIINAGGSLGQFVFAPIAQALIQMLGWMGAMWSLALIAMATLPFVRVVSPRGAERGSVGAARSAPWQAVQDAVEDRSYMLLNAGFFTCGFHIAFLVTHLPGQVNLCGLPPAVASWSLALIGLANIAGSLMAGSCTQRFRSKNILAVMYGSRALLIAWYLAAPKTKWTFYSFAVGLGLTWLATVPPTATIVGKLFGVRYLSTLFGLTILSHQIGGFLGAYLGGLALVRFGDYQWMWYADMALAAAAAVINLPIREARIAPVSSTA